MPRPETIEFADTGRRHYTDDAPRPVRVHLWRQPGAGPHPAVVVSHGTGGAAETMSWLTEPLAEAGIVVAAVDHHGNNYVDGYQFLGFIRSWDRPPDLSLVIDRLTADAELGPVGVAGFSLGGYTAAALLGARLAVAPHIAVATGEIPMTPTPEFPELATKLTAYLADPANGDVATVWPTEIGADYRDRRVRAGFLVCPALGQLVEPDSLAAIDRPVAVRWANDDDITPPETHGEFYTTRIPGAEGRGVPTVNGHYGFLAGNTDDRPAQQAVAAAAVDFFGRRLS